MTKVVLAMSGGVDSSVAAHLLLEDGYEVVGVFMRHGEQSAAACAVDGSLAGSPVLPILQGRADHKQGCCSASDAEDARRVSDRLQIPFYALNLESDFRRIVDYFADEYTLGRTPNPCVMCNNWIKFGRLFQYADRIGADFVATGHYARLEPTDGEVALLRGIDTSKDQAYVLFGVSRELLPRMMLPVGGFEKSTIRELAEKIGLRVHDKRDSQEICFVNSGHHAEFVQSRRGGNRAGEIVTTEGRVVGQHDGIERYTVGQRKGLGVAMGEPYFVVRIEPESHRVVIGRREETGCRRLEASATNWLTEVPENEPFSCLAKIRYNSPPAPAVATRLPGARLQVVFDTARHGVAPGQAVVCFRGDRVLGGGWIDSAPTESSGPPLGAGETL